MRRSFVITSGFERTWKAMGLGDEELWQLEAELLSNPEAGDVIPGLSGARKVRVSLAGHGKSGGGRVIYVDVVMRERIYLLIAYPKGVQKDLTPEQKQIIRRMVEAIKRE